MKAIQVIMATYNGSQFIDEQIKSILINFDKIPEYNCQLLISDDCSSDNTADLINKIATTDNRIIFVDGNRKGGVKKNFNFLINAATADYVFFSDQDDFWLPNKMKIFMERFVELEKNNEGPILIHSDLSVVDKNLSPVNISMFAYQKINKNPSLPELIVSNSVTGCVMACNKNLIDGVKGPAIEQSIMHDWFIALYASAFGTISFIDAPLILYRQHGNNQVGAKSLNVLELIFKAKLFIKLKDAQKSILITKQQADLFFKSYKKLLNKNSEMIFKLFINSFDESLFRRAYICLVSKFKKFGFVKNSAFMFLYIFRF